MITSHQNPLVKRIRRLERKKYRQTEGAFFVEGIRVVLSALERGARVEVVVYAPELLTSDVARDAIRRHEAAGGEVAAVSGEVFRSVSQRDNPAGLGAIVSAGLHNLDELPVTSGAIFVGARDAGDPGNVGTIVRTIDGVGAAGLILVGQTTDPFHPTAVKASMGTLFNVPVVHVETMAPVWAWAEQHELFAVATSARATHNFWEADYRFPALLLLGSEGEGLPAEVLARADLAVSIPMLGTASSLNLAVAAGLLLYELRRRQP
ncbi:MAG: RNA methyltransferase [Anaerolineae bacterium]|nr:RNA methyltransferase [Anaerolineae bacterium]